MDNVADEALGDAIIAWGSHLEDVSQFYLVVVGLSWA
jgi:hypothetical protein